MPMKQENRTDPDTILQKIARSEMGKLTVFLGASAGVGKTYTMLETAHERLQAGIDVVIGWVETHGRKETEGLVSGLPVILPKCITYRGKVIQEMDIDAILARRPELVLVDELAHTNIQGSRHVRRFQDVEELLKAGINVYTTLNIQHIESLNDVVAQITGVIVRETVPDYVVEQADNVQLIDISPQDLIKRLQEGKVYVAGQAEQALRNFFRQGNINALREMALRFMAKRVDSDLSEYMREHKIDGPWPASGKVMVCVSASPFSAQLIRAACRLAAGLQAEWLAVHIETNTKFSLREKERLRDRVARNMRLAEELGAKTISIAGRDLLHELLAVARNNNVTAIVVGKPQQSRLRDMVHESIVNKLIRHSGGINVYVIQAQKEQPSHSTYINTEAAPVQGNWQYYLLSFCMIIGISGFGWFFKDLIEIINIALLYQLPVTLSAFWWGRWPSYFTAVSSMVLFDFLFVPPVFAFTVYDLRYIWSFITFLIVAFIIGGRTEFLREEADLARQRERSIRSLYSFSKEIAAVVDLATITRSLAIQAADTLGRRVMVLLPDEHNQLMVCAEHEPGAAMKQYTIHPVADSTEAAVAAWVYAHCEAAGRSAATLPSADYLYLPLVTREHIVGVLGIKIIEKLITPEQRRLMEAWAGLAAIAIERVQLTEKAREAELLLESDKLKSTLFNSVSHELRTPLASIIGSALTLRDAAQHCSPEEKNELWDNIIDGAKRMTRIVANLLDTARLEGGTLRLKNDWCDLQDIIGVALRQVEDQIKERAIQFNISAEVPIVRGDGKLLEQVMVNLLDNAFKYSPANSPVEITVVTGKNQVQVSVADRGIGIPAADLTQIFDKFYRAKQIEGNSNGIGLGLSICRTIIEAHNGKIWAENRPDGGTMIHFFIPVPEQDKRLMDQEGSIFNGN
ncbi:sensor histidine kinase [Sporomusa acidovorans]|uniref:histidine kinase n=1 Tax=Sporomusa acidovorans (strain ATCC 49682 / DSM 3132 / Mol) TaxID=1123286 RepID=A0ABZ3IX97_SPOA4|nr:sensor histidine kinase KdpD [Sporomusa acidovorans]OZC23393.1 sensor protein KdpD [Sporomusa acidovorans DSM 3132]SDE44143.1 two-component system, OmpR family, sensor histidine kinase KdpD [Sporomusa acidovorans]